VGVWRTETVTVLACAWSIALFTSSPNTCCAMRATAGLSDSTGKTSRSQGVCSSRPATA